MDGKRYIVYDEWYLLRQAGRPSLCPSGLDGPEGQRRLQAQRRVLDEGGQGERRSGRLQRLSWKQQTDRPRSFPGATPEASRGSLSTSRPPDPSSAKRRYRGPDGGGPSRCWKAEPHVAFLRIRLPTFRQSLPAWQGKPGRSARIEDNDTSSYAGRASSLSWRTPCPPSPASS